MYTWKTEKEKKSRKSIISRTTQHKATMEQLMSLSIKNNQGNEPSRCNSSTNQTEEERLKRLIKHLKVEIDNLK